jgi:hypothetical protein
MKIGIGIVALVLLGGLGFYLTYPETSDRVDAKPKEIPKTDPPTTTLTDSAEVFRRAFWQRPSPEDRILNAERREWSDENGVKKWQWFLVVEPSPALVKRLRVDNAFGLTPLNTAPSISDAPPWFNISPGDVETLAAAQGNLRLFFTRNNKLLYATDKGGGFRPGVPESAVKSKQSPSSTDRLPTSPPPDFPPRDR